MVTAEERALRAYVDAFNRHDLDAVMECFVDKPVVVDMLGRHHEEADDVRRYYALQFAMFPDARCDIRALTGRDATGMAETDFSGTHVKTGRVVTACGAEVVEFTGGKIKGLRDYHRLTSD